MYIYLLTYLLTYYAKYVINSNYTKHHNCKIGSIFSEKQQENASKKEMFQHHKCAVSNK